MTDEVKKGIAAPSEDKPEVKPEVKPAKKQKRYFFSRLGKTIKAASLKEAISKIKDIK